MSNLFQKLEQIHQKLVKACLASVSLSLFHIHADKYSLSLTPTHIGHQGLGGSFLAH